MKKLSVLCIGTFCLLSALPICAQEQNGNNEKQPPVREVMSPEKSARKMTDEMKKSLQLTEKQYEKIYKLNLKEQKKRFASMSENGQQRPPMGMGERRPPMGGGMRPEGMGGAPMGQFGGGDRPPMMGGAPGGQSNSVEDLEKAAEKKEKKIKKILTDEQYAKWQTVRQSQEFPRRPQGGDRRDSENGFRKEEMKRN